MASNELIDNIISVEAFKQVEKMQSEMRALMDTFIDAGITVDTLNKALAMQTGIENTTKGINSNKQALSELEKVKAKIITTQEKSNALNTIYGLELERQKQRLAEVNTELQRQEQLRKSEEDSLTALKVKLGFLKEQWSLMGKAAQDANQSMLKEIQQTNVAIREQEKAMSGRVAAVKVAKVALTEQELLINKITKATSQEGQDVALLRVQLAELNKINKQVAQSSSMIDGSIEHMSFTLNRMREQFTKLSPELRNSPFGIELNRRIQATDTELKKLDAGMGVYKRNVGNYSNATFQLSQSLRELPAFAFSAQTGILALSNNLPMLVDSFNQVKASAGGAGKALAVFGRSIFTFTNLFTIALGLFTVFYQDIIEFVTGVTKAEKATKKLASSLDESQKAFISAAESVGVETIKMQELYSIATDVTLAYKTRIAATNELQRLYPKYLGNLRDEVIMAGEARDAYNQLNQALMNKAMFAGFSAQAEEIGKGLAPLIIERDKILAIIDKLKSPKGLKSKDGYFISGQQSQADKTYLSELEQQLKLLNAPINAAQNKILQLFESAKKYADLSETITSLDETKTKKPKKEQEVNRIEELKNQYENERKVAQTAYEKGETDYLNYQLILLDIDKKYSKIRIDARTQKEKDSLIDLNLSLAKNTRESYLGLGKLASDSWEEAWKAYKAGSKGVINENMLIKAKEDIDKFKAYLATLPPAEIKVKLDFDWKDHLKEIHATMEAISSAIGAIGTAFEIQNNIELAALDNKTKANERYYEDEQLRIKSSGKSKQEQEKELIKLEAQRSAQNRAIEREKADLARKQAKRQKMIDIAQISLSTAAAIMGYLKDPGGYVGIALSIAAGITGAAQIAKAQATPLPEFAKGTENSPEGYAIVGEKGTELVTDPSGKSWLTPAKDTITYLKKGSKVTTNEKLMEMVKNSAYVQLANMNTPVTSDMYSKTLVEQFETLTSKVDKLSNIMQDKAMSVQIQGNYDHYIHVRNNIR